MSDSGEKRYARIAVVAILLLLASGRLAWTCWGLLHPPLPVLLFHRIGPPRDAADFWAVPRARFERILELLEELGLRTVSLEEVRESSHSFFLKPPRGVLLTFDDGDESLIDPVAPLLKKHGMNAAAFVNVVPPYSTSLPPSALATAADRSVLTIQSHAFRHVPLLKAELGARKVLRLLRDARAELARIFGHEITAVAYPCGEYDGDTPRLARKAGYELGFTTDYGWVEAGGDPLLLPRLQVTPRTGRKELLEYLEAGRTGRVREAIALCCLISLCLLELRSLRARNRPDEVRRAP